MPVGPEPNPAAGRAPTTLPATEADAAAVIALWTEAYVTHGVGGRSVPYALDDFLESSAGGEVYVAREEGGGGAALPLGAVVLSPSGAPRNVVAVAGEAELARLAVAIPARRRGIGRALTLHCEGRARAAGWPAIVLWSRPAQTEAHRLYESLGYERAPERDSVDPGGQARWVFRLEL